MKQTKWLVWVKRIIVILVCIAIPMAVWVRTLPISSSALQIWGPFFSVIDLFHWVKSMIHFVAAIFAMLTIILLWRDRRRISDSLIAKLVGVFMLFVAASTLGSEYFQEAIFGMPHHFEGALTYLAYSVLFFFGYMFLRQSASSFLMVCIAIVTALMSCVSFMQFIGLDPLRTEWIKPLINAPSAVLGLDSADFNFSIRTVYGTLSNPNYVGSFVALVAPMLFFNSSGEVRSEVKIFYRGLGVVALLMVVAAQSSAGIVGILSVVIVFILRYARRIRTRNAACAMVILLIISALLSPYAIRFVRDITRSFEAVDRYEVTEMEIVGNEISVSVEQMPDFVIVYQADDGKLELRGADGRPLGILPYGDVQAWYPEDPAYQYFSVHINGRTLVVRFYPKNRTLFASEPADRQKIYRYYPVDREFQLEQRVDHFMGVTSQETAREVIIVQLEGRLQFYNYGNTFSSRLNLAEHWLFEGYEHAGSGRGYIWSRSLPLVKENLVIGTGPGTYAFYFPQEDVLGKLNYMNRAYGLVDKPHSLYLQLAINMGLGGLVVWLLAWGLFFRKGWRYLADDPLLSGIYFAMLAFLVTSLFNDSVVSVSPMFWLLAGYGTGLLVDRRQEERES